MLELLKYRRGQIRGIDFSLAMIIFLLTMSQVLVLTTTFIENSQSFQSTSEKQEETNNYAQEIFYTTGSYSGGTDWSSIPTVSLTPSWTFGLSDNRSRLDPFKLNRLADNNVLDYSISYNQISDAVGFNNEFRIKSAGTINNEITNFTVGATVDIDGQVTQNGIPLTGVEVWIFMYEEGVGVSQSYVFTNSNGLYQSSLTPNGTPDFRAVTVIAKYGMGNQDLDFQVVGSFVENNQTLFKNSSVSGYNINVASQAQGSDPTNVNYYSFFGSEGITNSSTSSNPTLNNTVWETTMNIPQTGLVGIFSHESVGGVHYLGFTSFPIIMDGDLFSRVEPLNEPGNESTVIQVTILVRGVILEFTFTKWE